VFGVLADGQVMATAYPTLGDAERYAEGLFQRGFCDVAIIDRTSGRAVKRLIPPRGKQVR
jgi:hypothetical protein